MGAIILLAVSVSLDSLSTGMAYAISGIRIPWTTRMMMAVLEPWEGVLIGLTMAFDSMSAGIGIQDFGGARYAFPFLAAFAGVVFLTLGNYITINVRCINAIGGILLIGLGLFRCLFVLP